MKIFPSTGRAMSLIAALILCAGLSSAALAVSSEDIFAQVKQAELRVRGFSAGLIVTDLNKKGISDMGRGYSEIMQLERAVMTYTLPDKIHCEGIAHGFKASYDQDGYIRRVKLGLISLKQNMKNSPGKMQSSLDLGFLSSKLWENNEVSVVDDTGDCLVLQFKPKFGNNDKKHDLAWVDLDTLKVMKLEKYGSGGDLRIRIINQSFINFGKLPIAAVSVMYDPQDNKLGTVSYKDFKII